MALVEQQQEALKKIDAKGALPLGGAGSLLGSIFRKS